MDPIQKIGMSVEEFLKYFNQVLLLTRQNNEDHFISYANVYLKRKEGSSNVHSSYRISDLPPSILEEFRHSLDWGLLNKSKTIINKLSLNLNLSIVFYEDLFAPSFNIGSFIVNTSYNQSQTFKTVLNSTKKLRIDRISRVI